MACNTSSLSAAFIHYMYTGIIFVSGHFLLTHLLMKKLQSSAPSRIINVACVDYRDKQIDFNDFNMRRTYKWNDAYGISKLALLYFTEELDRRLAGIVIRKSSATDRHWYCSPCECRSRNKICYCVTALHVLTLCFIYFILGSGVQAFAAFPGLAFTNINRNQAWYQSYISYWVLTPLYWLGQRSAYHASQVINYCAVKQDLTDRNSEEFYLFHG